MSMDAAIPVLDPTAQVEDLWDQLLEATGRVLRSNRFILGPEVQAFEAEVAALLGSRHAVGCNSGTDALVLALRALGIGPGDEVITTPFTFFATAEAISQVGARPVFADIDPDTLNLDPGCAAGAVTRRTRALLPVHLFGHPCAMDDLLALARQHGLAVVEDCAQSFGAHWRGRATGTLGAAGCLSFFPSKNLAGYGDGGMLVCDDPALAEAARMLRVHGSRRKYHNETIGYNSRLDELQAALLRVKLPRVAAWNQDRRRLALGYEARLAGLPGLRLPERAEGHVFHQYTVRLRAGVRDRVAEGLARRGIASMVYYPVPCHRLEAYRADHAGTVCPVAEAACAEVLSLPLWPEMTAAIQDRVATALVEALREA